MGMWQVVQQRQNERRVLIQSRQWDVARRGLAAIMTARYKAGRDQQITAEHFRLTRYRLTVLDEGSDFEWLSLDEGERLSIAFDPDAHTEFRTSRHGRRQVAASVAEVDAAGRELGSVELAVQKASDAGTHAIPDEFMGEPASISVLEQQD